jgi:hypothetical protein
MISIVLRGMLPRLLVVGLAGIAFYLLEPGFHRHDHGEADLGLELGVYGLAATLANFASVAMLILLSGFISGDRRHGYYRMYFSHPTRPLAFYGLRWVLALGLALAAAAVFLVVGQLLAWGTFEGGWRGLYLALLAAVAYGGLTAAVSATVSRGDAWIVLGVFIVAYFWLQAIGLGVQPLPPALNQLVTFVLPPQFAMSDVYDGLLRGEVAWAPSLFVLGYGAFWLLLAGLLVKVREWP